MKTTGVLILGNVKAPMSNSIVKLYLVYLRSTFPNKIANHEQEGILCTRIKQGIHDISEFQTLLNRACL